jgi:hypothetical protein
MNGHDLTGSFHDKEAQMASLQALPAPSQVSCPKQRKLLLNLNIDQRQKGYRR